MKVTRITRSLFILFLSLLTLTWSVGALTAHAAPLVVGTITQFAVLGNSPNAITRGPDGNLWFTEPSTDQIGRITTSGTITQFAVLGNSPHGITSGPDGNLWFTEPSTDQIGRITTK